MARRFGSPLRLREQSLDVKLLPWLDSLVRDVRLGARMLRKNAVVTAAAVVSLSLALGACVAAFSLVDALILRPLPVRAAGAAGLPDVSDLHPERPEADTFSDPLFVRLRDAGARARRPLRDEHAGDAAGDVRRAGEREGTGAHAVRVRRRVRAARRRAGRRPAAHARRTIVQPGAHPVAVVSHAFWLRRFGGDPAVVGRWFTLEERAVRRSSASPTPRFTGVEPGRPTDVWVPYAMYNPRAFGNFYVQLVPRRSAA